MYDLYCDFDVKLHSAKYPHYLEVVMFPDGKVEYAVPSHQEKLIKISCDKLGVSREELYAMIPREYYCDVITWLCNVTGCISIWTDRYETSDTDPVTDSQKKMLKELKMYGVYEGDL